MAAFKEVLTKKFVKSATPYMNAIEWLWDNRKTARTYIEFNYPDYVGMPKTISYKLPGEALDVIQGIWPDFKNCKTKAQFFKMASEYYLQGII